MIVRHVSTAKVESPITLEEIKDHLQIARGETVEDETLKGLRAASIEMVQNYTGRKLMTQEWKIFYDDWPYEKYMELPFTPLSSSGMQSTGIKYTNSTSGSTDFGSTAWSIDYVSEPPRIVLEPDESWPTDILHSNNPIEIEAQFGYAASSDVPQSIKHAMFLMIGHWYENRENTVYTGGVGQIQEIPSGAKSLLEQYRVEWF